jgi:hypothetical protein
MNPQNKIGHSDSNPKIVRVLIISATNYSFLPSGKHIPFHMEIEGLPGLYLQGSSLHLGLVIFM